MLHIIIYGIHRIFLQTQFYNGTESASYLGPKIWEQIPAEIKNKHYLDGFKKEIKKWKPIECPYRICKTLVPNLGFVW